MRRNSLSITAGPFGLLALAVPASADFINVDIQELDLGAPEGFVTYRVVAHFDGPDIVLMWGSLPMIADLHFYTGNDVDLVNGDGALDGLKFGDFAGFSNVEYDSWVTVGATELAGNETNYSPGFLGGDGVHRVIEGHEFWDTDGIVFDSDLTSPVLGPDVVLAQFTIPGILGGQPGDKGHNGFHLEGLIAWNRPNAGGIDNLDVFVVDNIPAPGSLVLLGLIGLTGAARRRRDGTAPFVT
ncbi:MAG: hypothetical protein V3T53_05565 [Phycisphaerales bacterium]